MATRKKAAGPKTAGKTKKSGRPKPRKAQPNYAYWQQSGGEWVEEYDKRKKYQPLYHIQEVMLADYFAHSAPAKVLEFGCGIGRHLRYLNELSGIEVYGFDQSPTMIEAMLGWTSQDWMDERVALGAPTRRLPYPDNHFDIVYSVEVLVHVRPEDLDDRLAEMLRVAKWQVLHLETGPQHKLASDAHGGCWSHDLPAAYERLGRQCETLPYGYTAHTPYRVVLESDRKPYTWSPVTISLLRRMEVDLAEGIAIKDRAEAETSAARSENEALRTERDGSIEQMREAQARAAELQGQFDETCKELEKTRDEGSQRLEHLDNHIAALKDAKEQSIKAKQQRLDLEKQIVDSQAALAKLREEAGQRLVHLDNHISALKDAKKQANKAEQQRLDLEKQIVDLQAALAISREEASQRLVHLDNHIQALDEAKKRAQSEDQTRRSLEEAIAGLQTALKKQEAEAVRRQQDEAVKAEQQRLGLEKQVSDISSALTASQADVGKHKADLEEANKQAEIEEQTRRGLEERIDVLQAALKNQELEAEKQSQDAAARLRGLEEQLEDLAIIHDRLLRGVQERLEANHGGKGVN